MNASGHDPSSSAALTPAPLGGRLDKALERTSQAPLRIGNRLVAYRETLSGMREWLDKLQEKIS